MITKFLEGLGTQLASKWIATTFTPALMFWTFGLYAWASSDRDNWNRIEDFYNDVTSSGEAAAGSAGSSAPTLEEIVVLVFALGGGLLLIALSAAVANRFLVRFRRLIEGQWPLNFGPLQTARSLLISLQREKLKDMRREFLCLDGCLQKFQSQPADHPWTAKDARKRSQLDARINLEYPLDDHELMPTRLGNVMRAGETYPYKAYGLDMYVCWTPLWLILPESTRSTLTTSREDLNLWARIMMWSILGLVWVYYSYWALALPVITAVAYSQAIVAASVYADTIRSTFHVHRMLLYDALRWPRPANPAVEPEWGTKLTTYLWRGSTSRFPRFQHRS